MVWPYTRNRVSGSAVGTTFFHQVKRSRPVGIHRASRAGQRQKVLVGPPTSGMNVDEPI